jgi:hypothetical protein
MSIDPSERARLTLELRNLQATLDQFIQSRDEAKKTAIQYGGDHPTAKISEKQAKDYDLLIVRFKREISDIKSRLQLPL